MSFRDRINTYTCDECGGTMVTVDLYSGGDTPYFTHCCLHVVKKIDAETRQSGICGGRAVSSLYDVDQTLTARWEWYKPVPGQQLHGFDRWKVAHDQLLLRARGSDR